MRRHGWRPYVDLVEVDTIEVVLEEDEPVDEFLALLHEIALEAIALRAHSPGDPRVEVYDQQDPAPVEGSPVARFVRRLGTRRLVIAAAIVVAAVGVAIARGVVEDRQAAARLAALEASPGVLAPAPEPPTEAWRTPGRLVADQAGFLLVAAVQDGPLRRVDPVTGEPIWTAPSDAPSPERCFPVDEAGTAADDNAGQAGLLACIAPAAAGGAAGSRVIALDPTDGSVASTLDMAGALLAAEPVGGDLIVAARLVDGRVATVRWDVRRGERRWDYTSPQPVPGATADAVELREQSLTVGGLALDLTTGDVLDPQEARLQPIHLQEYALPGGEHATWWWYADGAYGQGRVTSDHGMRVLALLGPPLVPALTDGSQAATLVSTADGDQVRGLDLRNGRTRWSRTHPDVTSLRAIAQVGGVMVLQDGATVVAIDVSTGDWRWDAPADSQVTGGAALTDGEVLLLPERRADGGLELVARRITDGSALWTTTLPTGTSSLTVVDQRLIASIGDDVIGLG